MSSNLFNASAQWAYRPDDERFWTLDEMLQETRILRDSAAVSDLSLPECRVEANGNELLMVSPNGNEAAFSHYAFGQTARLLNAPANYLRTVPAVLVAPVVNHHLRALGEQKDHMALFRRTDDRLVLNAITGQGYSRIWNCDIAERLIPLQDRGWRVPPARPNGPTTRSRIATAADCLKLNGVGGGLSVKPGDTIAPAGLYASDHDMFAFMVNEDRTLEINGVTYKRGFFVTNSEVGDRAFWLTMFLYNSVCGNHIVWDAQQIKKVRVVHRGIEGAAGERAYHRLAYDVKVYGDSGTEAECEFMQRALEQRLGEGTKDSVIDAIFGAKLGASRAEIEASYVLAEQHPEDGHQGPDTVLGIIQGMTRLVPAASMPSPEYPIIGRACPIPAILCRAMS